MTITSIHQWNKWILCQSCCYTPALQAVLANIDSVIDQPLKVLKNDRTSTVVLIEVEGRRLVVKRFNTKNYLHAFRRWFLQSRAKKNWLYALKLQKLGIPTLEPIALLEERWGPLPGRSYLISTYLEGKEISYYLKEKIPPLLGWKKIAQEMGKVLQKFAAHPLAHGDLNPSNIILLNDQLWLIDLDSIRWQWRSASIEKEVKKEQNRLLKNWQQVPEVSRELMAFFQAVFNE